MGFAAIAFTQLHVVAGDGTSYLGLMECIARLRLDETSGSTTARKQEIFHRNLTNVPENRWLEDDSFPFKMVPFQGTC